MTFQRLRVSITAAVHSNASGIGASALVGIACSKTAKVTDVPTTRNGTSANWLVDRPKYDESAYHEQCEPQTTCLRVRQSSERYEDAQRIGRASGAGTIPFCLGHCRFSCLHQCTGSY